MANRDSKLNRRACWVLGLLALGLVASALPARAAEEYYDPKMAGNPVRIAAYIMSPVGEFIDYVILRPAWWVGSHEPFRTIFGRNSR
jgi:hypothetical protein